MSHQFSQQQKYPIKRIKSTEKNPTQAPVLSLPPSTMNDYDYEANNSLVSSSETKHKPLLLPSRLKDYLTSLQVKNNNPHQSEKKSIELMLPSFPNKNKQNQTMDLFSECQQKIRSPRNNQRKSSFMSTGQGFNFHKKRLNDHIQQISHHLDFHPSMKSLKAFSETVSTDSSGKRMKNPIKLTDFKIGRKLGTGKYGQVFIVRHKRSGMIFALKKIYKADIGEDLKVQLIHQIKIQMFLDHPNIIKLYAFFSDDDYLYLLMEMCTSGHLYDLLKRKKNLPEKATKIIVKQLCQGIDFLHQNDIIHRDLKLENILYHFGMIKICDFGWSTVSQSLRNTFCGTPLYISPELLRHQSYSNKVDIWSIGVLGYQLLFGRVPFQIRCQQDFNKIVEDELQFPPYPEVSLKGKNFLRQCLNKNPETRAEITYLVNHKFLQNCETINCQHLF